MSAVTMSVDLWRVSAAGRQTGRNFAYRSYHTGAAGIHLQRVARRKATTQLPLLIYEMAVQMMGARRVKSYIVKPVFVGRDLHALASSLRERCDISHLQTSLVCFRRNSASP